MRSEKRLRILCLHGYRQNEVLFREKTGSLRKIVKNLADFHFVCAPNRPNVEQSAERGDVRAWWFSKVDSQFSSRDVTDLQIGFQESVAHVLGVMEEHGPFDGLLGFSQGASLVHLLLAMRQLQEITFHEPRFVVFFSGFLSLSSAHERLRDVVVDISSLHVYGSKDEIVLKEVSERLASRYPRQSVILHDGGHFIPPMAKYKTPLVAFVEEQLTLARANS